MTKCSFCSREAVTFVRRTGKYYCEEHFIKFFLGRVRSYLDRNGIRGRKVLAAISGGKDSAAMLHALCTLREEYCLEISAFHIDLGIRGYSSKCRRSSEELCDDLGIELEVLDLRREYGRSLEEIARRSRKPCSSCGTIKRYLTNKRAYEKGCDYIATGHNMLDEGAFALHNLYSGAIDQFMRGGEKVPPKLEKKMVGRIKPLYYLLENETLLYSLLYKIPYSDAECPYSFGHPILKHKQVLLKGEELLPGFTYNVLRSLNKLRKGEKEVEIKFCKICGFPTTSDICKFCRIVGQYRRRRSPLISALRCPSTSSTFIPEIQGILDIIAPTAIMGSVISLTIPRGALPFLFNSYKT